MGFDSDFGEVIRRLTREFKEKTYESQACGLVERESDLRGRDGFK